MHKLLEDILDSSCRTSVVSDNERTTFQQYTHLQKYHPGLDRFIIENKGHQKNAELPTKYKIVEWKQSTGEKTWRAYICDTSGDSVLDNTKKETSVFVKTVHLLDPIGILKDHYWCPEHPLLPAGEKTWENTLYKLHSPNNQAYIDAVANFVLSRFREENITPHCIYAYGSLTGIASAYRYNISQDFMSYRQCRWFWKGLKSHGANIVIIKDNQQLQEIDETIKEYMECPFDNLDAESENDCEIEILKDDSNSSSISDNDNGDLTSLKSYDFEDNIDNNEVEHILIKPSKQSSKIKQFMKSQNSLGSRSDDSFFGKNKKINSENDDEWDGSSFTSSIHSESDRDDITNEDSSEYSDSTLDDIDITIEIPTMPVILIAQEAQEGTMDALMDLDEIDGIERDTPQWEARWLAWTWQIVAVLCFLQKSICFTHNDLHTNNIVWRKTNEKHLYYRGKDGSVWKVPTYGKIFSLIDFGRSIFKIGKTLWISDDHWPENDAGDQYNFGPIYDPRHPKVTPNPSFDLSRLSVSLLDGLFDEFPEIKKPKKGKKAILNEEPGRIMYETVSPLFNLLWSWTIDERGKTIYENPDGSERFPGFDIYIHIAHHVHSAIPKEQIYKPVFERFRSKQSDIPENTTVYPLGC